MDTNDSSDIRDTQVPLTLRIDKDLYRRIRVAAAQEEKSATQWMREALRLVVERVEATNAG